MSSRGVTVATAHSIFPFLGNIKPDGGLLSLQPSSAGESSKRGSVGSLTIQPLLPAKALFLGPTSFVLFLA